MANDEEFRARFLRESRMVAAVDSLPSSRSTRPARPRGSDESEYRQISLWETPLR